MVNSAAIIFRSISPPLGDGIYALEMGVDSRTAQRHLTHFADLGLLLCILSGSTPKYQVIPL